VASSARLERIEHAKDSFDKLEVDVDGQEPYLGGGGGIRVMEVVLSIGVMRAWLAKLTKPLSTLNFPSNEDDKRDAAMLLFP
jgi:hypothetical protein